MLVTSATCPKCRTSLAIARPVRAGTPLDCPRCLTTFRAPQPRPGEEIDELEVVDDEKDDAPFVEAVEEGSPAARRRSRKRPPAAYRLADGKPRFRGKKKESTNVWIAVAVAAVGGALLLGVVAWLALSVTASSVGDEPLAFIPPDSNVIVGARLGDLTREAPAIGRSVEQPLAGQAVGNADLRNSLGVDVNELIDHVTVALTADGGQLSRIFKSRSPYDRKRVVGRPPQGMTKASAFGQSYLRVDEPTAPSRTMYCPNNRILVTSTLVDLQLQPVLKSDGKRPTLSGPLGDLAAKLSPQHLWVAVTPDGLRGLVANSGGAAPPGLDQLAQAGNAIAMWATVQEGKVDLHVGLQCADDAAAQQALTKMQTEMPALLTALEGMTTGKPGLAALIAAVRTSAKFAASGPLAEMSAQVPVPAVEAALPDLEALAGGRP